MAVVSSYTENTFASYLLSQLEELADSLGWTEGSAQVREAVNDALLDQDASDIASVTGSTALRQLRALGRRAIWRAVVQATAGDYAFTTGQDRFERQQVNAQAREMLKLAEAEVRAVGADSSYAITVMAINRPHDPYAVLPDEERGL